MEGRIVRPRQVRYQAAIRPDSIAPLILNHFPRLAKRSPLRKVLLCFFSGANCVKTVPKTPSVQPRCVITEVLIKVLLVRLPIQLH